MDFADAQFVEKLQQITRGGSRLLVTLARGGKRLERDEPQRAAFLLAAVATHPLYKGGRLAFDMLEIEDLMLDSSPVYSMRKREVIQVLNGGAHHLIEMLKQMGSSETGRMRAEASIRDNDLAGYGRAPAQSAEEPASAPLLPRVSLGPTDEVDEDRDMREIEPQLRSSDYLYDYVVLGLLEMAAGIGIFDSERKGAD